MSSVRQLKSSTIIIKDCETDETDVFFELSDTKQYEQYSFYCCSILKKRNYEY